MSSLQGLAQLTSSQIVNCLVLGSAIAALAGAASSLLGRKSSGVRFVIWFSALVATAAPLAYGHCSRSWGLGEWPVAFCESGS
jgi:hypothetical protein